MGKALVLGGTRFMGKHLVTQLLNTGWEVTLATRGQTKDAFGSTVKRLVVERTDPNSLKAALSGKAFDAVSMREVLDYVEKKTGKSPVFSLQGEDAPYDGEQDFTLNTEKAEGLGFRFTPLQDWIWKLIDQYIKRAEAC